MAAQSQLGRSITAVLVLFCSTTVFAQVEVLRRPRQFTEFAACIGPESLDRTKEFWKVWADRDGIPVYEDSSLQTRKTESPRFLESFYVSQITNDKKAVLLVRSKSEAAADRIAVDGVVGWVKTDFLLLREAGSRTEKLVPHKALVVDDLDDGVPLPDSGKGVAVRTSPREGAPHVRSGVGLPLVSYVYKYDRCENPGWLLLGTKQTFSSLGTPEDVILGWVRKDASVEWNTREALEPDPVRALPVHVFASSEDLANFYSGKNVKPLWEDDMDRSWTPGRWRFLLLSKTSESARVAVIDSSSIGENSTTKSLQGWVRLNDDSNKPLLKPVYLMSQNEVKDGARLLEEFGRLGFTDTVGLVEIWRATIRSAIGSVPEDVSQYASIQSALSFRSLSAFSSRNSDGLSQAKPDEISAFLKAAKSAATSLHKIDDDRSLWFKTHKEVFAWISATDMP